jgi:hypothetical protein
MGDCYAGIGSAAAGTNKTILALISATTVRPQIYQMILGSITAPADIQTKLHLERFTAIGTEGSGFTPLPLDSTSPAALGDYGVGVYAAEPTYTASAILMAVTIHQRATWQWNAYPGRELVIPKTANNGIGLQSQSSGATPTIDATIYHME